MTDASKMKCMRCNGRKKLYKFNNGYSHANMGGPLVDCPLCLGTGFVPGLQNATDAVKEEVKKEENKIKDKKEKESKDAKEDRDIGDKA